MSRAPLSSLRGLYRLGAAPGASVRALERGSRGLQDASRRAERQRERLDALEAALSAQLLESPDLAQVLSGAASSAATPAIAAATAQRVGRPVPEAMTPSPQVERAPSVQGGLRGQAALRARPGSTGEVASLLARYAPQPPSAVLPPAPRGLARPAVGGGSSHTRAGGVDPQAAARWLADCAERSGDPQAAVRRLARRQDALSPELLARLAKGAQAPTLAGSAPSSSNRVLPAREAGASGGGPPALAVLDRVLQRLSPRTRDVELRGSPSGSTAAVSGIPAAAHPRGPSSGAAAADDDAPPQLAAGLRGLVARAADRGRHDAAAAAPPAPARDHHGTLAPTAASSGSQHEWIADDPPPVPAVLRRRQLDSQLEQQLAHILRRHAERDGIDLEGSER